MRIPSALQPGDVIGITCPAGYMPTAQAAKAIQTLQKQGYEVWVGKTLGSKSKNYFSGTDEERLAEMQAMLDEPSIKAILCGRGGYGVSRIIDQLDFTKFRKQPKWIIGFSDITVLHAHVHRRLNIATLHAPMAAAFQKNPRSNVYVQSLLQILRGEKPVYSCKQHRFNQYGKAEGILVGGNLALLAHLCGTASDIQTKGKILFLEDVGEYLYNIDRMMLQLKRSGKLDQLAGLIIGGFTDCKDTERPFGKKVYEIIASHLKEYSYPICYDFPVSHGKENYALVSGGSYRLQVSDAGVTLQYL